MKRGSLLVDLPRQDGSPQATRASWYTPGLSDGLGDRLLMFDNTTAAGLELLRFKQEFSEAPKFAPAVERRVEQLRTLHHKSLATVRAVEWLGEGEGLALVSNSTPGKRLSEVLHEARGASYAMALLHQLGPALAALHKMGNDVAHGAVTPDRIVVTPEGQLVLVEHVLGSALDSLNLPAARLRTELGLVVPYHLDTMALDSRSDVAQLAFIALSLLLGRRLDPADYPDRAEEWLELAAAGAVGLRTAPRLRAWLECALLVGRNHFESALEAHDVLEEVLDMHRPRPTLTPIIASTSPNAASPAPPPAPAIAASPAAPEIAAPPDAPAIAAPSAAPDSTVAAPAPAESEPAAEAVAESVIAPAAESVEALTPETETTPALDSLPAPPPVGPVRARTVEPVFTRIFEDATPKPVAPVVIELTDLAEDRESPMADQLRRTDPGPRRSAALVEFRPEVKAPDDETVEAPRLLVGRPEPDQRETRFRRRLVWIAASLGILALAEGGVIAGLIFGRPSTGSAPIVLAAPPGPVPASALPPSTLASGAPNTPAPDAATPSASLPAAAAAAGVPGPGALAAGTAQGRLEITSDPPGARVSIDGVRRGVTPLGVAVAVGSHTVLVSDGTTTATRTLSVAAGGTSTMVATLGAASGAAGWLTINVPIEMQIFEGESLLGSTSAARLMLPVGPHELLLVNKDAGFQTKVTVEVQPGKVANTTVAVPNGSLSVNALPWANVWLDGRSLGTTPIANLDVPLGTHEVIWRHPQFGERRQTVVVTTKAPVRLVMDLRK
jgi:PEGA domain-containing protein